MPTSPQTTGQGPSAAARSMHVLGLYLCATDLLAARTALLLLLCASVWRREAAGACMVALLALVAAAWAPPVQAAVLPFVATAEGTSSIVEVLDPLGPVVRVQTLATGDGTPGPLVYHSGDIINLASGQGQGSNRFVSASGDELLGTFSVQMVPGADASLFDLIGDVVFQGGTGAFQGASGRAAFRGSGQFFSASQAHTRFEFQGTLNTVAAPSTLWLVGLAGLVLAASVGPRRRPLQALFSQASASFTQ